MKTAFAVLVVMMLGLVGCGQVQNLGSGSTCRANLSSCNNQCVELPTDPNNCGQCGNVCPANQLCEDGVCVNSCGRETTACGQSCVSESLDDQHCGSCNTVCTGDEHCFVVNSQPTCQPCQAGQTACYPGTGGLIGIWVCSNLSNDFGNCGSCNRSCRQGQQCVNGACQ